MKIILISFLLIFSACVHVGKSSMKDHGPIIEVLPEIFMVTGKSIYQNGDEQIQKSNNMVIVRQNHELTLINTLALSDEGLLELEALGTVKNVVRLGAFHDRNDGFYLERYQAKLWALSQMVHKNGRQADYLMDKDKALPFRNASFFWFETTNYPEAILHIERDGGILITCDSIKNWTKADEYFSSKTAQDFMSQGLIAEASIDNVWLNAMNPKKSDFERLLKLKFKYLLSAHGELLKNAHEKLKPTLLKLSNH